MEKHNIILTGFMGTGKTTVGRLLAKQLDYAFVDTDELIKERAGKTVPEIFQEKGESAFRDMEAAVARELAERRRLVIATGGRLMLDPFNAAVLGRTGRVFCLVAAPEEILARIAGDRATTRPLLTVADPQKRVLELLQQRREGYGQFQQVTTSGQTPEAIIRKLLALIRSDRTV